MAFQAISDVMSQLEDDLCTCSVCMESLKNAKQLRCSHVFCSKCLEQLIKTDRKSRKRTITCPICRCQQCLSLRGLKDLQKAHLVQQIMDFKDSVQKNLATQRQKPSKPSMQCCSRCDNVTHEWFFCLNCTSILCGQCKCCPLKKHQVISFSNASKAEKNQIFIYVVKACLDELSEERIICSCCHEKRAYYISLHTSVSLAVCQDCSRRTCELNDVKCNWIPCHHLRSATIRSMLADSFDKYKHFSERYNKFIAAEGYCTFCVEKMTNTATWMCLDCMLPCCMFCLIASHYVYRGWGISFNKGTISALLGCRKSRFGRAYKQPIRFWLETCSTCDSTQSSEMTVCLEPDCGKVFCLTCALLHFPFDHLRTQLERTRTVTVISRRLGVYKVLCSIGWMLVSLSAKSIQLINVPELDRPKLLRKISVGLLQNLLEPFLKLADNLFPIIFCICIFFLFICVYTMMFKL